MMQYNYQLYSSDSRIIILRLLLLNVIPEPTVYSFLLYCINLLEVFQVIRAGVWILNTSVLQRRGQQGFGVTFIILL